MVCCIVRFSSYLLKETCVEFSYIPFTGRHLSMLPVEPKLGKMLIYGAIFNCLDPILTVVAGLTVRDPFLTPFDKKDVCEPHMCF